MSTEVKTEFTFTGYGKNYVKLLQVRKEGKIHYIKELEVSSQLTLNNTKDYLQGDNSDIIATDSQKNTIYVLAKQHGVRTIERFALLLCDHFLNKYRHVTRANVYIEEAPWKRIEIGGQEHSHSFILNRDVTRFCEVEHKRATRPVVSAGIKDLKVMKTTQSAFVNFVNDEFRTLPDAEDRIFCTIVQSRWNYNTTNVDFDKAWEGVKKITLETFAGEPREGVYSPSVQNTLYLTEQNVLARIPQIEEIEMVLPNVHYFDVDFKRFPKIDFNRNQIQVLQPVDKPSGNIKAAVKRSVKSRL